MNPQTKLLYTNLSTYPMIAILLKIILWILSFLVCFTHTLLASQEDEREKVLVLFTFRTTLPASIQAEDFEPLDQARTNVYQELIEVRQAMVETLSAEEWDKVFGLLPI